MVAKTAKYLLFAAKAGLLIGAVYLVSVLLNASFHYCLLVFLIAVVTSVLFLADVTVFPLSLLLALPALAVFKFLGIKIESGPREGEGKVTLRVVLVIVVAIVLLHWLTMKTTPRP